MFSLLEKHAELINLMEKTLKEHNRPEDDRNIIALAIEGIYNTEDFANQQNLLEVILGYSKSIEIDDQFIVFIDYIVKLNDSKLLSLLIRILLNSNIEENDALFEYLIENEFPQKSLVKSLSKFYDLEKRINERNCLKILENVNFVDFDSKFNEGMENNMSINNFTNNNLQDNILHNNNLQDKITHINNFKNNNLQNNITHINNLHLNNAQTNNFLNNSNFIKNNSIQILQKFKKPSNITVRNFIASQKKPIEDFCIFDGLLSDDSELFKALLEIYQNSLKSKNPIFSKYIPMMTEICVKNLIDQFDQKRSKSEKFLIEQKIKEIFNSASKNLIPLNLNSIKKVNEYFLKTEFLQNVLVEIIKYIGVEEFVSLDEFDISKHCKILKRISNYDISILMKFNDYRFNDHRFNDDRCNDDRFNDHRNFPYLAQFLPGLSNFCTDHYNNINNLLICYSKLISEYPGQVYASMRNLIFSHKSNLSENHILGNPIPKGMSDRILQEIRNSEIPQIFFDHFYRNSFMDYDECIFLLVNLTNTDMSEEFSMHIYQNDEEFIYNALRMMPYFIKNWKYDFLMVTRLLELISSTIRIQKKAYYLLHQIVRNFECKELSEMIFEENICKATENSALKNRMKLLISIYERNFISNNLITNNLKENNLIENNLQKNNLIENNISQKILQEIFFNLILGNAKCKSFLESEIAKIVQIKGFWTQIMNNLKHSEDSNLVNGSLMAVKAVISDPIVYNDSINALNPVFDIFKELPFKSQDYVLNILKIFNLLIDFRVNEISEIITNFRVNEISEIVTKLIKSYLQNNNKRIMNELKNTSKLIQAKNKSCFSKEMAIILRHKNKGGPYKKIQVLKK